MTKPLEERAEITVHYYKYLYSEDVNKSKIQKCKDLIEEMESKEMLNSDYYSLVRIYKILKTEV